MEALMKYTEQNIEQIREHGLKVTGPRMKILHLFENHPQTHMTADDVYRIILEENMNVGVATVYRVLSQFEEAGILLRHHFESGKAVYELNRGNHHDHIVCLQCNKITEFVDEDIERIQERVAEKNGYQIVDHAMYIYGMCAQCRDKQNRRHSKK